MGSQISAQTSEDIQTSLNSIVNETITNVNSRNSNAAGAKQRIVINMDKVVLLDGAKISATQSAMVDMSAFSNTEVDTISDISQDIESQFDVEKEMDTLMEQEGIILFQSQMSLQKRVTKQSFSSDIKDIVKSTIETMLSQKGETDQELVFNMGDVTLSGKDTVWEVSQESVIKMMSESISKSMVDKIIQMKVVQTASASTKMTAALSQEGINPAMFMIALAVMLGMVLLVGGAIYSVAKQILLVILSIFPIVIITLGIISLILILYK